MKRTIILTALLSGFAVFLTGFKQTQSCTSSGPNRCGPNEEPVEMSWPTSCLTYRINDRGTERFDYSSVESNPSTQDEKFKVIRNLTRDSFNTWDSVSCTGLDFAEGPPTSQKFAQVDSRQGRNQNINVVVWRDDGLPDYMGSGTVALTSVSALPSARDEIIDADIEVNTTHYEFADIDDAGGPRMDLRNTLTHEIGHLIGLAHTPVEDATMAGGAQPGEIKKRTLHQDDIDGVCHIYPTSSDVGICEYEEPNGGDEPCTGACCGCSSSGNRPNLGVGWLFLSLFALSGLLRRRRN